jgi:hypothetical protein
MMTSLDHSAVDPYTAAFAAKTKNKLGCWNCGKKGHHSSNCPNPLLKSKSNAQANVTVNCAGATSAAPLGNGGPSNDEDNDSFDKEIDVVWG